MLNIFLYKHNTLVPCHSVHIIQGHRSSAVLWLLMSLAFMLCIMKTIIDLNNWPSFSSNILRKERNAMLELFFGFDFHVIGLACFQMKVRSKSRYYNFVALLLPSWPCENSKQEIAFFSVFGTIITLRICVHMYVCTFDYGFSSWGCFCRSQCSSSIKQEITVWNLDLHLVKLQC